MLRTILLAPLAGVLAFASPAIAQMDNRPGDYQRYAEDRNADDGEDAQQGEFPPERGRYAYRLDDDRDATGEVGGQFESYGLEPDQSDDREESADARDSHWQEWRVARQRLGDRQDMVRKDRDRYAYPLEPNRDAIEEGEGDQGADSPGTYRSEPSRSDREEALPRREKMESAGAERTGLNRVMPERLMDGTHPAPRRDYPSAEAIWHVRAALNVAALNCRDANELRTVAAYNAMLSAKRATLAAADAQTKSLYRIRFGGRWQNMHDTAMTKLYNFFAQPPAHEDFCRVAQQVLDEAQSVPDATFSVFANDALARLEAPFVDSRRQMDGYRASQGSWHGATS